MHNSCFLLQKTFFVFLSFIVPATKLHSKSMESHSENRNETTTSSPVFQWSVEYQCITVNGILAPAPLSMVPIKTELGNELQPESSTPAPRKRILHGSPSSIPKGEHELESCKKKRRTSAGNEELFFRVFKFPNVAGEEYLLEMHEMKTGGGVVRSHLNVHESNGRWKIDIYDLAEGNHVVVPLVEDSSPLKFPRKYDLPLLDRLSGWTVEKRKRSNGKEDKFYYHGGRQFRSYVEVTAFLLYSTRLKDLKTTTSISQVHQEKKAAEAMIELSSSTNTAPQVEDGHRKHEVGVNPSIEDVCDIFNDDNPLSIAEILGEDRKLM